MASFRCFVFTINNYTEADEKELSTFSCDYLIYGREIGDKKETPHLQGYCELNVKQRFKALKNSFIEGAHIEPRKGTQKQAIDYCKKDDCYFEFGERKKQGVRNDIVSIKEYIETSSNPSVRDLIDTVEGINFVSLRVFDRLIPIYEPYRDWKPYIYWFYGASGAGKTKLAVAILGKDHFPMSYSSRFFNGYDAHPNVLFDDFRKNSISFNEFLRMTDRYKYICEVKGGSRQFVPKLIVITSDEHPSDWWSGNDLIQILRRVDTIYRILPIKDILKC